MKLLLIASKSCQVPLVPNFIGASITLTNNFETDIESIKNENADLIIIPAEQSISYLENHLLGGLELLVWLRIKGVYTHIVVTSFFPLQTILQRTKLGFILGSKGVSFHQLPKQTGIGYFKNLVRDKAEQDNLKSYLATMFDMVQFRHAYANIWGLKRLVEVHKKYDTTFDDLLIKSSQIENSLNYQIAEFIFGVNFSQPLTDNSIDDYINGFTKRNGEHVMGEIQKVKQLAITRFDKSKQSNISINKILLIDDQADTGWEALLKSILPVSITLEKLEIVGSETETSLINKFSSKYKDDEYLMVILDLRLLKSEEHEHNYENLLSVKLMQQMLSKKNYSQTEFHYPYLKFVLFTASNQLHNMLTVLSKNEYTPHRIFIKEGFDINQTKDQLYKNYLSLLQCINQTAIASQRGKPKKLESFVLEEQAKIQNFNSKLEDGSWQEELNQLYITHLKEYTHIILDTNIFYLEKPMLPLSPDCNIILCYPVFKEMERLKIEREETYNKFCAEYFIELYKGKVDNISIGNKLSEIDIKFQRKEKDIADNYFVDVVEYYSQIIDSNLLFVSNDKKGKAGNNNNEAPIKAVLNKVKEKNIQNVSVATIFNGNFKLQEIVTSPNSKVIIPVQKNQFQKANSSNVPFANNTSIKKTSQRPKIKWSDCLLQSNGYDLKTTLDSQDIVIRIGKAHTMGFKTHFEKLQKTLDVMELDVNQNGGYNIYKISDWINKAKKL